MGEIAYEVGRLNLPVVGHCTCAKAPPCTDWQHIAADVAVVAVPNDMGTQWRCGARMGPRAMREASTLFSFGHGGAYDFERDATYLRDSEVRIVDVGDADIVHTGMVASDANTEAAIRCIPEVNASPVVLGGDRSVHAPVMQAFCGRGLLHIVHLDAHLDFVDERYGVRFGHGSPLRGASEMSHVRGMTQLGIRNVSSSNVKE